ncbi:hypothetical protein GRI44_05350 [Altererythrobacter confluentis]|uniref:Lipoprotein n=1 Tax=Allopontixanthobacter confluentis TaxID=1849021 RepID=A0A6L7GDQ3_9SPHN|nr:hypothetical protein [Allopontixanthobacter confluentis]MXP14173.1 hypothetical protein [Allopontixanthobacter confluentis]
MSKLFLVLIVLLATSCGKGGHEEATSSKVPPLVAAAHSVSLEFPLQFDSNDTQPGYTKVASADSETPDKLISALVSCSPSLAWIEKTSHTIAIIIPSDESEVWKGVKGWRPSDEDIIACVKDSANQPFFYRKLPTGIETYSQ